MEDLNNVLNMRKVLDLFENEELDSIVLRMRSFVEQSGYIDNRQSLLAFFQKVLVFSNYYIKLKVDYIYNSVPDFQVG